MVVVRALIVLPVGCVVVAACARVARRWQVTDRLRSRGGRALPGAVEVRLARALDAAAVDSSPMRAVQMWLVLIVAGAVIGGGVGGGSAAVGGAVLVVAGGPVALWGARHRGARLFAAAVPAALERVASELRAGGTIATALEAVAASDSSALASDFARVGSRVRLGSSLRDALALWSSERPLVGVDAAAGALAMCAAAGGRSADALDGLASSLRDRAAVADEARALSAQARMSAVVIGGAPFAYLAWSALVDPSALHALSGTGAGRVCLLCGAVLDAVGLWWMQRIVRSGSIS